MIKWTRRHPGVALAGGCAFVLALIAAALAYRGHLAEQHRVAELQRHEQERLAERRQRAFEEALLVALSGDLETAEQAIQEVEREGGLLGQVRVLRGLVALSRDEHAKAIQDLKQAVTLLPESAAAQALLGQSYLANGEYEKNEESLKQLDQLPLRAPEDYLFKGWVWMGDPVRGLPLLQEAIRRRPSAIAYAIRAGSLSWYALNTTDPASAQQALDDAHVARAMMPGTPVALWTSMETRLRAALVFGEIGEPQKRAQLLAEARAELPALERLPPLPRTIFGRAAFCLLTGDEEAELEVWRRASEQNPHPMIVSYYATGLWSRGQVEQADALLERGAPGEPVALRDQVRAYLLPNLENGAARARAAYQDLTSRYHGIVLLECPTILLLLGHKREAVDAWKALRQHPERCLPYFDREFGESLLDYCCERISDNELVRAARGS